MFVKGLLRRFAWSCGYRKVVEAQLSKMCVMFSLGGSGRVIEKRSGVCIYWLRIYIYINIIISTRV